MTPDDYKLANYLVYALITTVVTLAVGRSLHRAGDAFLRECFHGDVAMSGAVNHLLLVGFHLVSFGALALLLKLETPPHSANSLIECLAHKLGTALGALGLMHLFNLWNFDRLRRRALNKKRYDETLAADLAAIPPAATPPPLPTEPVA